MMDDPKKKKKVSKPAAKPSIALKVTPKPTPKPNTTTVPGARIEKKITKGGMYKIRNEFDERGNLVSSDTSRTLRGVLNKVPKKGSVTAYKKGGPIKKKK